MKGTKISPNPWKTIGTDRDVLPSEIRDMLDHLAEEIAADYQRLLTHEPEVPAEPDRPRKKGADR